MAERKKQTVAENGVVDDPKDEVAELLNEVSMWSRDEVSSDEDAEARIGEYFNLCASKGEMPLFETLCLYLGISDDKGKEYAAGEGCSGKMTRLIQTALTTMKAAEAKAVYKGKIRDVPYIWRSKQYFGYREPNSKLEDALLNNVLKELPPVSSIAARYVLDVEESEDAEGAEGEDD